MIELWQYSAVIDVILLTLWIINEEVQGYMIVFSVHVSKWVE